MSVLISTYEDKHAPIVYFYKLIPLGSRSTGEATLNAVLNSFNNDGLIPLIKSQLISVVSDGGSKFFLYFLIIISTVITQHIHYLFLGDMIGRNIGFATLIKEWIKRPIISHWCLAHRNEKIYETAMKQFPTFRNIEQCINSVHSFYSRSSKRTNDLDYFATRILGLKKFRLKHIFDVR